MSTELNAKLAKLQLQRNQIKFDIMQATMKGAINTDLEKVLIGLLTYTQGLEEAVADLSAKHSGGANVPGGGPHIKPGYAVGPKK